MNRPRGRSALAAVLLSAAFGAACAGSSERLPVSPSSGAPAAASDSEPTTAELEAELETSIGRDEPAPVLERDANGGLVLPARELSGYSTPGGNVSTLAIRTTSYEARSTINASSTASFSIRGGLLVVTVIGHRSSCGGGDRFSEARLFVPPSGPSTILMRAETDESRNRCLRSTDQELVIPAPTPGEYIVQVGRAPRYMIEIPPP